LSAGGSSPAGRLEGRIALVTGASRGFGAAAAVAFAAAGAHVVLLARTLGGLEETDDAIRHAGGSATLVEQDLRELDAIDRLGQALHARWGRLDILLGNAGELGPLSPLGHIDPKAWERLWQLNVSANFRLLRSLDPLLRLSPAGRAIFVTCEQARRPLAFWAAYAASKRALEALAQGYAQEIERTAVRINLFEPPAMPTRLRAQAMPGEDASRLAQPAAVASALLPLAASDCSQHGQRLVYSAG